MDIETLKSIGLTKNESIIYLTLAKIGESKVNKIIKESKFKSGKIYQVLDSLSTKGIVSHVIKNNIKYFSPNSPERILEYLRLKKQTIEKEEEDFLKILPKLEKTFSSKKNLCDVRVYDNIDGIRTVLFTFVNQLKSNSTILIYGANDDTKRDIILSWPKYRELTKEKKIKTKVIMSSLSKKGRLLRQKRNFKNYDKEYRFLKGSDVSNFMVCEDKLIIFNFNEPNAIYIENKDHANQFKELFKVLWKNSQAL